MPAQKKASGRSASTSKNAGDSASSSRSTIRTEHGRTITRGASRGSTKRPASRSATVASNPEVNELAAIQPLSLVKSRFSEMVERVNAYQDRITVTKNGVPVAVLLSADDFESLVETIEILTDPQAMSQIAEGRADIERGDVVTGEELARRYGLQRR